MGRNWCSIVPRVLKEACMASTVDEIVFLVTMSWLTSNHIGTRAHLQRINVVQDARWQCAMGYDIINHGLWKCDTSRQVNKRYFGNAQYGRDKAHFWILKEHGFSQSPQIPGLIRIYISPFLKQNTCNHATIIIFLITMQLFVLIK
jgi:hypothetical protein